jgi:hypothetical protein
MKPTTIFDLKGLFAGQPNCLIVGGGPSGKDWEKQCDSKTFVIACNGAIQKLHKRANMFICTEVTGYRLGWIKTQLNDSAIRVFHKISTNRKGVPPAIPIVRSYHMAGFNPREYVNSRPIIEDQWNSKYNWYTCLGRNPKHGVDFNTRIEAGLIKGPVTMLSPELDPMRRQATGTVVLQALHLACYMGFIETRTIGADFSLHKGHHWFTDEPSLTYTKGATKWSPDDNFITVNGLPTVWFFAMGAAICAKKRLDFLKAGMTWRDMSDGLLQQPRIEHFFQYVKPDKKQVFWTYE